MRPSTLRALNRAAELTRQNRLTEAMLIAEPVILTADEYEGAEIRRWLLDHVADPRVVANPEQARNLLAAVSYVGGHRRARGRRLVGLFAAMYFGGLRPAEAVGLVETDLILPEQGWGSALLHRTRPSVGKQWTDSGRPTTIAG